MFQKGQGAPGREAIVSPEDQKAMMAFAYRRQEEIKVDLVWEVWEVTD